MRTLCDTCRHDILNRDCEYAYVGVSDFDEVNEAVMDCEDYEKEDGDGT